MTAEDVAEALLALLPFHKCGFYLEHNPQKDVHETVKQHDAARGMGGIVGDWVSEQERLKAIESDELWSVQWYPQTPIGFNALAAYSLGALLKAVSEFEDADAGKRETHAGIDQ